MSATNNRPIEPWELRDFYKQLLAGNEHVLEAVRALKPEPLPTELAHCIPIGPGQSRLSGVATELDVIQAQADAKVAYHLSDELKAEVKRLNAVVADQALTIATLKDKLQRAEHLVEMWRGVAQANEVDALRAENAAIRKSIGDGDYGPTAAELQRFRAREEKVQEALESYAASHEGALEDTPNTCRHCRLIAAVRDFKVTP